MDERKRARVGRAAGSSSGAETVDSDDSEVTTASEGSVACNVVTVELSAQKERYWVHDWFLRDVQHRLNVPTPDIDVFADKDYHVAQRFYGVGGMAPNAWDVSWKVDPNGHLVDLDK